MIPTIDMQDRKVPVIGLGTWQLSGSGCETAVRTALDLGYRHIDTAEMYGNEAEIGRAIAGVSRDQLFITTKLWTSHLRAKDVGPTADASLRKLKTDYVDLLLIHWPNDAVPVGETLGAMRKLQDVGKVRAIGVSNFPVPLMTEARKHAPIACNQIEYHLLLDQRAIVDDARQHQIAITAYCPLARGRLTDHASLARIATKHSKTPAQIALRWLVQQPGVMAIPKASSEPHLRANLDIFDFVLDREDIATLDRLPGNTRIVG